MGGGGKKASQLPRPTVALVQGACAEWGHEGAQQLLMRLRAQKHPNPFSLHTLCAPKVASPTWGADLRHLSGQPWTSPDGRARLLRLPCSGLL